MAEAGSGLAERYTTSRRFILDEQSVLIERREFADFADVQTKTLTTLTAAVGHAQRASDTSHRVETLVADLLGIVKRMARIHGLEITVEDGRASLDAVAGDPLAEAQRTFALWRGERRRISKRKSSACCGKKPHSCIRG